MKPANHHLTPPYARYLVRLTRPFPDFDVSFIKPVRAEAVRLLCLNPGDHVLDLGCGMGGSFPFLVDAVGPSGEVVGVEISPEVVINAQRRIARHGWSNVKVIESAAQTVALTGTYDGLVMFAAPDVYASEEALANVVPHLRVGARVVLFGVKTTSRILGAALNPLLRLALSKLSFETTPHPESDPWRIVAACVERLEVREYFLGTMFLASGSLASQ
jgi:SAM-dependent methyltransferase